MGAMVAAIGFILLYRLRDNSMAANVRQYVAWFLGAIMLGCGIFYAIRGIGVRTTEKRSLLILPARRHELARTGTGAAQTPGEMEESGATMPNSRISPQEEDPFSFGYKMATAAIAMPLAAILIYEFAFMLHNRSWIIAGLSLFLPYVFALGYLLPAKIAGDRSNPSKESILALNFLLGWTVVGWVVLLIWVLSCDTVSHLSGTGSVQTGLLTPTPVVGEKAPGTLAVSSSHPRSSKPVQVRDEKAAGYGCLILGVMIFLIWVVSILHNYFLEPINNSLQRQNQQNYIKPHVRGGLTNPHKE
jgi:hypothetical protein